MWKVYVDRSLTENAILNLVVNARDAMTDGGILTVELANIRLDDGYIDERFEDITAGRYVMLAVSDTGTGILPEILPDVFEPFFTTKPVGEGSGLGLSMIHGFMKQSGGTARIYSEIGVGTTVKLYFPAIVSENERVVASSLVEDIDAMPPVDVMVVEDDEAVRRALMAQVGRMGHRIIEAQNGDAAIDLIRGGAKPAIIITDVVMPGRLQGPYLAKAARVELPNVKVIYVSGYPNEASINGTGLLAGDAMLMKPVRRRDLARCIGRIIREKD